MSDFISYQTAEDSTDPSVLAQYVIEGIEDNNDVNGASTSDWADAYHAMDVYLSHNTNLDRESDAAQDCVDIITAFLESAKSA